LQGRKVVVMGAGGAARGVVYGLLKKGAEVSVYNRSKAKAEELCKVLGEVFGVELVFGDLEEMRLASGDIFIQTSSIWTAQEVVDPDEALMLFPDSFVGGFNVVMDIAYKPLKTPLLEMAERLGNQIVTGEKMLLNQALLQFELFTGKKAPQKVMEDVLNENLVH